MPVIERNAELARVLLAKREVIARELVESIAIYPRWKLATAQESAAVIAERDLAVFVDYLVKAFEEGNEDYLSLYTGEKLKQTFDSNIDQKALAAMCRTELQASRNIVCRSVNGNVGARAQTSLFNALMHIENALVLPTRKTMRVLWIADCIYLDIQSFLTHKMAEMAVGLDVTLVTTKNAGARRNEIERLATQKKFDIVFYSPFSYELNPDLAQFQDATAVLSNAFDKEQAIGNALDDVSLTLQCIAESVECDIFVHNTANLIRSEDTLIDRARLRITSTARSLARQAVNVRIAELIDHWNEHAFGSVRLIDEMSLVEKVGERKASQYFYKSPLQHPAKLGALLADPYADIIFVEAYLKAIKVVVCDLDNTLWDGVIGEGDVVHQLERQRALRVLREKGILLSINSKNDVRNVHWRGALLEDSDFVCCQINWDSKPQNMLRIQQDLNLGFKNFLFMDDRPEERDMVQTAMPDILCLDATSEHVWRRIQLWADVAKNSGELDRTKMYKERTARESYSTVGVVDSDMLMQKLELEVRVRQPQKQELPRVTELVNRTNQFNCCNSRTTFREVQSRSKDGGWRIYVADARDRFGEMGIVSVLIIRIGDDMVDIDSFVLSCRVFGYGIEGVILRRVAADYSNVPLRGRIIETPTNEPCRTVYKDHGFVHYSDNEWSLKPGTLIATKPWLKVRD